jgi:hypothetical protein
VSVGLSGNLQDFGLADVFQLIGQQRKTGILELRSRRSRVQLVFDGGAVVSAAPVGTREDDTDPLAEMLVRCGLLTRERATAAQAASRSSAQPFPRAVVERGWLALAELRRVEDVLTRDTIFDVLRWTKGSFDFRAQAVEHDRDPASLLGAEQILMDGLRMLDEWRDLAGRVPTERAVFKRLGRFETYAQGAGEESPARIEATRRLFALIDGRLSARRVIDLALVGTFEGMRMLTALHEAGVIEPTRAEGGVRGAGLERGEGFRASLAALRSGAAAVLPLALLAAAAAMAAQRPLHPISVPAHAIVRTDLETLREGHATRRLRAALDTQRMVDGRWPARLDALLAADASLAAPQGRPYYSALREDGVMLLAPEH